MRFSHVAVAIAAVVGLAGCTSATTASPTPRPSFSFSTCNKYGDEPETCTGDTPPPISTTIHTASYVVKDTLHKRFELDFEAVVGAGSTETKILHAHRLPWKATYNLGTDPADVAELTISVDGLAILGRDHLTCQILLDGKVVAEESATGQQGFVICSGPERDD